MIRVSQGCLRRFGCLHGHSAMFLYVMWALLLSVSSSHARTYTVRPDGSGDFPTIGAAIVAAAEGDSICLAAGIYRGEGNRDLDYLGKQITIRSLDGNPEGCVIACEGSPLEQHRGVIWKRGEGAGAVLDGITIQGGRVLQADPDLGERMGAGALCASESSPTIRNVRFVGNEVTGPGFGGGLAVAYGSSPTVEDCVFVGNGAEAGAGVSLYLAEQAVLDGCEMADNEAYGGFGGGISVVGSVPRIRQCLIKGNTASFGAGVHVDSGYDVVFENCTIAGNHSSSDGGGVYVWAPNPDRIEFRGCTISGNSTARYGSGIRVQENSRMSIENSIVSFGVGDEPFSCGVGAVVALVCCDVFGNEGGEWTGCAAGQGEQAGNFSADPLFCSAETGDFHLRADSPCSEINNPPCGLVGAWPVGCDGTPVQWLSWGKLRSMFIGESGD